MRGSGGRRQTGPPRPRGWSWADSTAPGTSPTADSALYCRVASNTIQMAGKCRFWPAARTGVLFQNCIRMKCVRMKFVCKQMTCESLSNSHGREAHTLCTHVAGGAEVSASPPADHHSSRGLRRTKTRLGSPNCEAQTDRAKTPHSGPSPTTVKSAPPFPSPSQNHESHSSFLPSVSCWVSIDKTSGIHALTRRTVWSKLLTGVLIGRSSSQGYLGFTR